jgi:AraC-like DNA-binding protein
MLQTTRETVIRVASEVGYDSEAAFNRAFKREFGVPPGQFRRSRSVGSSLPVDQSLSRLSSSASGKC